MSTPHGPSQPSATPVEDGRVHDTAGEPGPRRRPYTMPALECLGAWRALTLQQSVPIGMFEMPPGGRIRDLNA